MLDEEVYSRSAVWLLQERKQGADEALRIDPVVTSGRDLVFCRNVDSQGPKGSGRYGSVPGRI